MQRVAVCVGEDLDLDVARLLDVAFQQHAVAAEGIARLALAALEIRGEFRGRTHDAHALAAATVRGLDHQRIADGVGFALQYLWRLVFAGIARYHRHAGRMHQLLGAGLAAHLAHRHRLRADEDDACGFHRVGEVGVLAEEAVARMNGLRAGLLRDFDDHIATQVRLLRSRPADAVRLVGLTYVLRIGVGLRVHGHGADAELARAANDPAGDFTAVGDQDLREHQEFVQAGLRLSRKAVRPSWPSGDTRSCAISAALSLSS